jgi:ribosome-binding factor A
MSRRTERIAEQLKGEIARILIAEATDPRIGLVTLTRVDVAPDLSNAMVFWSALEAQDAAASDEIQNGLQSAASFVRRRLAQVLPLRRVPELRFRYDPSLILGDETLSLLKTISDDAGGPDDEAT